MKRSSFFKSLLGLAVAPIVAREVWQGRDEMLKEYERPKKPIQEANKKIWAQIPATYCISTAWEPEEF